jgi:hypothetical protein
MQVCAYPNQIIPLVEDAELHYSSLFLPQLDGYPPNIPKRPRLWQYVGLACESSHTMEPNEEIRGRLRALYPDLTDDQLDEAEDNLRRYLALVVKIFERKEMENENTP